MAMTAAGSIEAELRGSVAVANVAAAQLAESCEALRRKLADVEAAKAAAEEREMALQSELAAARAALCKAEEDRLETLGTMTSMAASSLLADREAAEIRRIRSELASQRAELQAARSVFQATQRDADEVGAILREVVAAGAAYTADDLVALQAQQAELCTSTLPELEQLLRRRAMYLFGATLEATGSNSASTTSGKDGGMTDAEDTAPTLFYIKEARALVQNTLAYVGQPTSVSQSPAKGGALISHNAAAAENATGKSPLLALLRQGPNPVAITRQLLSQLGVMARLIRHLAEESEADAARLMDKEARISQLQERVVKAGLEVSRLASEAAQVTDLQRRLDSSSHEAAELRVLLKVHKAKVKEQMGRMVTQAKLLRDQLGDRHQAAEAALAVQVELQERLHQELKQAVTQSAALKADLAREVTARTDLAARLHAQESHVTHLQQQLAAAEQAAEGAAQQAQSAADDLQAVVAILQQERAAHEAAKAAYQQEVHAVESRMQDQMQVVMAAYASELTALHDQVSRLEKAAGYTPAAAATAGGGGVPNLMSQFTGTRVAPEPVSPSSRAPIAHTHELALVLAQHQQEVQSREAHAGLLQDQLQALQSQYSEQTAHVEMLQRQAHQLESLLQQEKHSGQHALSSAAAQHTELQHQVREAAAKAGALEAALHEAQAREQQAQREKRQLERERDNASRQAALLAASHHSAALLTAATSSGAAHFQSSDAVSSLQNPSHSSGKGQHSAPGSPQRPATLLPGYMSNSPSPHHHHHGWLGHKSQVGAKAGPGHVHTAGTTTKTGQVEQCSQAAADTAPPDGRQLHKLREKYEALKMKYIKQTLRYNELQQVVLGAAHAASVPAASPKPAGTHPPTSTQPPLPQPTAERNAKVNSHRKMPPTDVMAQAQTATQQTSEAAAGASLLHAHDQGPPRPESPGHLGRGSLLDEPSFGLLMPPSPKDPSSGQTSTGAPVSQPEKQAAMHTWSSSSAARSASIAAAAAAVAARAAATAAAGAHITIGSTAMGGHQRQGLNGQQGVHGVEVAQSRSEAAAVRVYAPPPPPPPPPHTARDPEPSVATLTFHARTTSIATSNYSAASSTQVADDEGSDDLGSFRHQSDPGHSMHMARHTHANAAPEHDSAVNKHQAAVGDAQATGRRPHTRSHEGPQVPREVLELAAQYAGDEGLARPSSAAPSMLRPAHRGDVGAPVPEEVLARAQQYQGPEGGARPGTAAPSTLRLTAQPREQPVPQEVLAYAQQYTGPEGRTRPPSAAPSVLRQGPESASHAEAPVPYPLQHLSNQFQAGGEGVTRPVSAPSSDRARAGSPRAVPPRSAAAFGSASRQHTGIEQQAQVGGVHNRLASAAPGQQRGRAHVAPHHQGLQHQHGLGDEADDWDEHQQHPLLLGEGDEVVEGDPEESDYYPGAEQVPLPGASSLEGSASETEGLSHHDAEMGVPSTAGQASHIGGEGEGQQGHWATEMRDGEEEEEEEEGYGEEYQVYIQGGEDEGAAAGVEQEQGGSPVLESSAADRLGLMDVDAAEEGGEGAGVHAFQDAQWLTEGSDEGEDVWLTPMEQGWPLANSSRHSTPDLQQHDSMATDQDAGIEQGSAQSGPYEASPVQQQRGGNDDDADSNSSPLRPWGRVGSAAQYLARQLSVEAEDRGHMDPHSSAGFSPERWPQVPEAGSQDNSPGPP